MIRRLFFFVSLSLAMLTAAMAHAGKIVVNHDEWTLSNTGFSNAGGSNAATFATNVASFFTGGASGNFLVYSGNFGLTQSNLATAMTGAGHAWTVNTGITYDLPTLQSFDGVFLAGTVGGSYPANGVLINYVNSGGNLYIAGGTGNLGSAAEAAGWNSLLTTFGLQFGSSYNGVGGTIATTGPSYAHALFSGVSQLYYNNGNSVSDITPGDPSSTVYGSRLFGVYESGQVPGVPEPATLALMGVGLAGLGAMRRRKRG